MPHQQDPSAVIRIDNVRGVLLYRRVAKGNREWLRVRGSTRPAGFVLCFAFGFFCLFKEEYI